MTAAEKHEEAEAIMRLCQIGTKSYEAANNLHAECYGIIGFLLAEVSMLQGAVDIAARRIETLEGENNS